jgi:hypothetical protein
VLFREKLFLFGYFKGTAQQMQELTMRGSFKKFEEELENNSWRNLANFFSRMQKRKRRISLTAAGKTAMKLGEKLQ